MDETIEIPRLGKKAVQETDDDKIVQKPKRTMTEKQKEIGRANLAKGRAALAEKKAKQKEEATKLADELVLKKAEKLTRQKANKEKQLKAIIGAPDDDEADIIEEHITKKPKKKKIIYREESDSEEEVIIRPRRSKREIPPTPEPAPQTTKQEAKPAFRINFV